MLPSIIKQMLQVLQMFQMRFSHFFFSPRDLFRLQNLKQLAFILHPSREAPIFLTSDPDSCTFGTGLVSRSAILFESCEIAALCKSNTSKNRHFHSRYTYHFLLKHARHNSYILQRQPNCSQKYTVFNCQNKDGRMQITYTGFVAECAAFTSSTLPPQPHQPPPLSAHY